MTKPFYERLKTYYQEIGKGLLHNANSAGIFPNSTDKGIVRENTYVNFLKNHLPSACNVCLGGFLFDLDGAESGQIDIIITCNTCLRYTLLVDGFDKGFACVEGTLGVVSVKSTLDSKELIDSLDKFAEIPATSSLNGRIPFTLNIPYYEDWPYKIIYAHNGISIETLYSSLNKYYLENPQIPFTRRPNLIHINGKGCVVRILPGGGLLRNGIKVPEHVFHPIHDTSNVIGLHEAIKNIQQHSLAAHHIFYNYGEMINKINFEEPVQK